MNRARESCNYPEHHSGGFPWGVVVVAVAGVIICTSGVFAEVVHDAMWVVLSGVAAVVVSALTGWALWLHHQRALVRAGAPGPIRLTARYEPAVSKGARRSALDAPETPAITIAPDEAYASLNPRAVVREMAARARREGGRAV